MKNKEPKLIAYSPGTKKGNLDDDYSLFDNGVITHDYDAHTYPGGYNLKRKLSIDDIDDSIKNRLYNNASIENKNLVHKLLKMDEGIMPEDYLENKPTYDKLKKNYINSVVLSRFYKREGKYLISDTVKNLSSHLINKGIISEESFNYTMNIANKEIEKKYPSDKRKENDINNYISQITPSLKDKEN